MASLIWRLNPFARKIEPAKVAETKENSIDAVAATISSAESSLVIMQRIAVWESPVKSLIALIGINMACWLIRVYQLSPVFVLAAWALLHLLHTQWQESIWPEIRVPPAVAEDTEPWTEVDTRVLSAPEMIHYVQKLREVTASLKSSLAEMRSTTPFMFFLVLNSAWSLLYVLSRWVSGAALWHALLTLAVTVPGALLHLVPDHWWCRLHQLLTDGRRAVANSGLLQDEDCERDFVPENSPETQAYLDVMADIINGREPSPDCHAVAAFSSGLDAAPGYDEESEDDEPLAPSVERPAELELGPSAAEGAAALGLRALDSAGAACGQVARAASQLVSAVYQPPPPADESDSDFELIGDEETLAAAGH